MFAVFQWVSPVSPGLMGTCYSNQSHTGKRTYPSDMSLSSATSTTRGGASHNPAQTKPAFGYKGKNIYTPRNSNEQPEGPDDRNVLTLLDRSKGTKNDSNKSGSRFGFRPAPTKATRADTNSNMLSNSSDSLDSVDSVRRKNTALPGRIPIRPNSFIPNESARWKMIDDSSTTVSMSTMDRSVPNSNLNSPDNPDMKLFPDANGNSPEKVSEYSSGSYTKTQAHVEKKFGSKMLPSSSGKSILGKGSNVLRPRGLKTPTDKWVKAGPVDGEGQKASRNAINTKKKFGFFSSKSKNENNSSQNTNKKEALLIVNKPSTNNMTLSSDSMRSEPGDEDDGDVEKVLCKDATREKTMTESLILEEGAKAVAAALSQAIVTPDDDKKIEALEDTIMPSVAQEIFSSAPVGGAAAKPDLEDDPRSESSDKQYLTNPHAPLAKMDSVETCSIGSINSDDLMLDLDIGLDEDDLPNQSSASLERSVFIRPRTKSRDSLDSQSSGPSVASRARPAPIRRPVSAEMAGFGAIPRRKNSLKGAPRSRVNSTSEAVAELSNMLTDNQGTAQTYMQAIQRYAQTFYTVLSMHKLSI